MVLLTEKFIQLQKTFTATTMLPHLKLITICLIIFFKGILADPITSDCNIPCDASDVKQVCGFDKQEVCFTKFSSKCVMERMACIFDRNYKIYNDEYCDMSNFLCPNMPLQSSPLEESNVLHTNNENSQEDVLQPF